MSEHCYGPACYGGAIRSKRAECRCGCGMCRPKKTSLINNEIHDPRCKPDKYNGCHPSCPTLRAEQAAEENDMTRAKGIHLQEWKHAVQKMEAAKKAVQEHERRARAHLWAYLNTNFVLGPHDKLTYEHVRDAWFHSGIISYWPHLFDMQTTEIVTETLRHMADNGVLKEIVQISCDDEHMWTGTRDQSNKALKRMIWADYVARFDDYEEISFEDALEDGLISETYIYQIPVKLTEPPEA